MLDRELWQEIWQTLRASKLRTAATALSVAWGIFMLVVLLASGRAIQNGAEKSFGDDAANSIWIFSGRTSKPHAGYGVGRRIRLRNGDYDALLNSIDKLEHATGRFYLSGEFTVRYRDKVSAFEVRACHPGHRYLEKSIITQGRFIKATDVRDRRKVTVIGPMVVELLFGRRDPLGQWIDVSGTPYRVVGVFKDEGWEGENSKIYIPISTAQTAYGGGDRIHQLMFTVADATVDDSKRIADETRRMLSARHDFALADERAIRIRNNLEGQQKILGLFAAIRLFVWIVGLGTILAGIVGVSNIMLIAVRERTKEIGIRKALGATPRTIVGQIVLEALVITSVSGYAGLVMGLITVELVKRYVPSNDIFLNPEVNLTVVVSATIVLVLAGVLAGYFPARLAARINPVEALRAE